MRCFSTCTAERRAAMSRVLTDAALMVLFALALGVCVNEVFNYFKEINDHE